MKNWWIWSAIIALLAGYFSAHSLFAHSWTAILFWGLLAILAGWFAADKKEAARAGQVFGMVLIASFLLFGFNGSADKLAGFLLLTVGLSIVGGLLCWLAAWVGYQLKTISHTPHENK